MIHVLARLAVEDLPTFLNVFGTDGASLRRQHGCISSTVYRSPANEQHLTILYTWQSREAFDRFTADPAVRATLNSSGTYGPPEFTYLSQVSTFPC